MKDSRSDNILPAAPEILDAVVRANAGSTTSYGGDEITARVRRQCCEIFETDVEVFPILSGIAGNALAIAALTAPWGAVFCHAQAHIEREELGAATFFSGGAKLVPIDGAEGKLDVDRVGAAIAYARKTDMASRDGRLAGRSVVARRRRRAVVRRDEERRDDVGHDRALSQGARAGAGDSHPPRRPPPVEDAPFQTNSFRIPLPHVIVVPPSLACDEGRSFLLR